MLFYILICLYHKGKSKESYGKCVNFLQKEIPIDRRDDDGNQNINEMYIAFDNYNVTYKEKEDIVQKNNKEFTKIGIYLRKKWELENSKKITERSIVRCMKKNLRFFSYAVLKMKKVFPDDFAKVKNYYLQKKLFDEIGENNPYWTY